MPVSTVPQVDAEQFERDGFVVVRGVLDAAEVAALGREVDRLNAACAADPPPADDAIPPWLMP